MWTKEQTLERQRQYRVETHNAATIRYEHSFQGHLMRTYRNMLSRVKGIQWKKAHLYKGKSILARQEFYVIAKSDPDYRRLFIEWRDSGYDHKLTPSVNRIDPDYGYENWNIEWVTHSQNSRLGAMKK